MIPTNITVQQNTQIKENSRKQTTQNTAKRNYTGSVAFYDTRPGNELSSPDVGRVARSIYDSSVS